MGKLKVKNQAHEVASIKYKGIKDGGKTFVDLKGSVAPTKTLESPLEGAPGTDVAVTLGGKTQTIKANTNKILIIEGGKSAENWTLKY